MAKNEKHINKVVGQKRDEYYFLDYVFDDEPISEDQDRFKGATGTIMRPVSKEEAEARRERTFRPENPEDSLLFPIWKEQAGDGKTSKGFYEWAKKVERYDGDEVIFDFSGGRYFKKVRELSDLDEIELVECIGGGRCLNDVDFDEVYNEDLLELIKEYEN